MGHRSLDGTASLSASAFSVFHCSQRIQTDAGDDIVADRSPTNIHQNRRGQDAARQLSSRGGMLTMDTIFTHPRQAIPFETKQTARPPANISRSGVAPRRRVDNLYLDFPPLDLRPTLSARSVMNGFFEIDANPVGFAAGDFFIQQMQVTIDSDFPDGHNHDDR